jgi:hypothetical protein
VTIQTLVSVVRRLLPSLPLWLFVTACTLHHTAEISRQVASDLGLRGSVGVNRSAAWALPDHAVVYLAEPELSRNLQTTHPRLLLELRKALEGQVQESFFSYVTAQTGQALPESLAAALSSQCNLLLQLSLQQADDNLSSVTERRDDRGLADVETGRDQLRLVMKILDVRSGRLLDTLSVDSRSGWWRWDEHQVVELVEPALSAMFERLRVRQVARHQQ